MQLTYYIIYKTTNLVNNKVYIGKHITQKLDDSYLGSGKLLRRAIVKYGVENFRKEILHVFDNEDDMNAKEQELVTEEFVLQESNYNLCVGGRGGFSYINREGLRGCQNDETHVKISNTMKERGITFGEHARNKSALAVSKRHKDGLVKYDNFKGKTHTEESKKKMSASSKGKSTGERNSQFGTRWITDGNVSKKIMKTEVIPDGWYPGRKIL